MALNNNIALTKHDNLALHSAPSNMPFLRTLRCFVYTLDVATIPACGGGAHRA